MNKEKSLALPTREFLTARMSSTSSPLQSKERKLSMLEVRFPTDLKLLTRKAVRCCRG